MELYANHEAIEFLVEQKIKEIIDEVKHLISSVGEGSYLQQIEVLVNNIGEFINRKISSSPDFDTWSDFFENAVSGIIEEISTLYLQSYDVSIENGKIIINTLRLTRSSILLTFDIDLAHTEIIHEFIVYPQKSFAFSFDVVFSIPSHRIKEPYFDLDNTFETADGLILELITQLIPKKQGSLHDQNYIDLINQSVQQLDYIVLYILFDDIYTMLVKKLQYHFRKILKE